MALVILSALIPDNIRLNVRLIILADQLAAFLADRPYRRRVVHFGLVCRMIKKTVRKLFSGNAVAPIEYALLSFSVNHINKKAKEDGFILAEESPHIIKLEQLCFPGGAYDRMRHRLLSTGYDHC